MAWRDKFYWPGTTMGGAHAPKVNEQHLREQENVLKDGGECRMRKLPLTDLQSVPIGHSGNSPYGTILNCTQVRGSE